VRRSSLEMDLAILQALSGNKQLKLTHIMYKANLNATLLKAKLTVLEAKGLIKTIKVRKIHLKAPATELTFYGLTSKGLDLLRSYLSVYKELGRVEHESAWMF
jgi:predicted transcriptional regulator